MLGIHLLCVSVAASICMIHTGIDFGYVTDVWH